MNKKNHINTISRFFSLPLIFMLVFPLSPTWAQSQAVDPFALLQLPSVGSFVHATQPFDPALIKGLTVHPEDPFLFDFIIHPGDQDIDSQEIEKESSRMIKYFLAALTVPEEEMWVNLSPYEKNRIIPQSFGDTEMGRDLLAQDYILKQIMSSLMYPEEELGREFWGKVYARAQEEYGTTDIPLDTFNKVWIVPERAVIHENGHNVFVVDSRLKVLTEQDYLASRGQGLADEKPASSKHSALSSEVIKEIIIPALEEEVNEGKTFANLRQISNAVILATWYKENVVGSLLSDVYIDQEKTKGIDTQDKQINQKIYNQYVESFKQGVYDFIKEDYDPVTQEVIPRKYFSGGVKQSWELTEAEDFAIATKGLEGSHNVTVRLVGENNSRPYPFSERVVESIELTSDEMKSMASLALTDGLVHFLKLLSPVQDALDLRGQSVFIGEDSVFVGEERKLAIERNGHKRLVRSIWEYVLIHGMENVIDGFVQAYKQGAIQEDESLTIDFAFYEKNDFVYLEIINNGISLYEAETSSQKKEARTRGEKRIGGKNQGVLRMKEKVVYIHPAAEVNLIDRKEYLQDKDGVVQQIVFPKSSPYSFSIEEVKVSGNLGVDRYSLLKNKSRRLMEGKNSKEEEDLAIAVDIRNPSREELEAYYRDILVWEGNEVDMQLQIDVVNEIYESESLSMNNRNLPKKWLRAIAEKRQKNQNLDFYLTMNPAAFQVFVNTEVGRERFMRQLPKYQEQEREKVTVDAAMSTQANLVQMQKWLMSAGVDKGRISDLESVREIVAPLQKEFRMILTDLDDSIMTGKPKEGVPALESETAVSINSIRAQGRLFSAVTGKPLDLVAFNYSDQLTQESRANQFVATENGARIFQFDAEGNLDKEAPVKVISLSSEEGLIENMREIVRKEWDAVISQYPQVKTEIPLQTITDSSGSVLGLKVLLTEAPQELRDELARRIRSQFSLNAKLEGINVLESSIAVNITRAHKGLAVRYILEQLGIAEEDVLVLGDSALDDPMYKELQNATRIYLGEKPYEGLDENVIRFPAKGHKGGSGILKIVDHALEDYAMRVDLREMIEDNIDAYLPIETFVIHSYLSSLEVDLNKRKFYDLKFALEKIFRNITKHSERAQGQAIVEARLASVEGRIVLSFYSPGQVDYEDIRNRITVAITPEESRLFKNEAGEYVIVKKELWGELKKDQEALKGYLEKVLGGKTFVPIYDLQEESIAENELPFVNGLWEETVGLYVARRKIRDQFSGEMFVVSDRERNQTVSRIVLPFQSLTREDNAMSVDPEDIQTRINLILSQENVFKEFLGVNEIYSSDYTIAQEEDYSGGNVLHIVFETEKGMQSVYAKMRHTYDLITKDDLLEKEKTGEIEILKRDPNSDYIEYVDFNSTFKEAIKKYQQGEPLPEYAISKYPNFNPTSLEHQMTLDAAREGVLPPSIVLDTGREDILLIKGIDDGIALSDLHNHSDFAEFFLSNEEYFIKEIGRQYGRLNKWANVIHYDIQLDHIFITKDKKVYVIDLSTKTDGDEISRLSTRWDEGYYVKNVDIDVLRGRMVGFARPYENIGKYISQQGRYQPERENNYLQWVQEGYHEIEEKHREDSALSTHRKGGIDFNSKYIDMQVNKDKSKIYFKPYNSSIDFQSISGFQPMIIQVTPVTNIPQLLGIQ